MAAAMDIATPTNNGESSLRILTLRKTLKVFLLLFLCSCSDACPKWKLGTVEPICPCYRSARMIYSFNGESCDIELELDRTPNTLNMYLNLFSLPIICCNAERTTPLVIQTEGNSLETYAFVFEGGQRLLISEEGRQFIIDTLMEGNSIRILAGRYSASITPRSFSEEYGRLQSIRM